MKESLKNKIILYFKNKNNRKETFSSEIFNNNGRISILQRPDINSKPEDFIQLKHYDSIDEVLNDADTFFVCTENSFTEKELTTIKDILSISIDAVNYYKPEFIESLIRKINDMIFHGEYLPDDKNNIIRK